MKRLSIKKLEEYLNTLTKSQVMDSIMIWGAPGIGKSSVVSAVAKKNKLEIKGVQPFTRILPDSSDLPIPLISKIFDSELFDVNLETRGPNEIIIAQTVEIIDSLVKNKKELEEFSTRVKDDITIDLLAQFSEALRKKYKITINDDVIDQLN